MSASLDTCLFTLPLDNIDDRKFLCRLFDAMISELPEPKKKK